MNNRLDFISNIAASGLEHMKDIRKCYMQLDDLLVHHSKMPERPLDAAASRALALARTHLEIALQFSIKTLCIQYEIKS
jgi:hypothetical protein